VRNRDGGVGVFLMLSDQCLAMEAAMTDPRYTDPNHIPTPREPFGDPVLRRRDPTTDRTWGWIAGIAVVLLIGFLVVAGWNSNHSNTASNPAPSTTGSAVHEAPAPAAPPAPAPNNAR
jgi:hypothetical protein